MQMEKMKIPGRFEFGLERSGLGRETKNFVRALLLIVLELLPDLQRLGCGLCLGASSQDAALRINCLASTVPLTGSQFGVGTSENEPTLEPMA